MRYALPGTASIGISLVRRGRQSISLGTDLMMPRQVSAENQAALRNEPKNGRI